MDYTEAETHVGGPLRIAGMSMVVQILADRVGPQLQRRLRRF